jgi:ABC-type uncharacterized transport system ATPase subunit
MSILYGFYTRRFRRDPRQRQAARHRSPTQPCHRAGIGMVHQHFMLVDNFTVLENVMLGAEDGAAAGPHRQGARPN